MRTIPTQGRSGHRVPLRLVDRVEICGPDTATVRLGLAADGFLQMNRSDPSAPWPAALVIEAMAQAAGTIAGAGQAAGAASAGSGGLADDLPGFLAAIDDLRLHGSVRVDDRLSITVRRVTAHGGLVRVACRATVIGGDDRGGV